MATLFAVSTPSLRAITGVLASICLGLAVTVAMSTPTADTPSPDFTKGEKPHDKAQSFFLHLDGVVMGIPNGAGSQIYIDKVEGHYISSLVKVGDVFLEVDGKPFAGDAVIAFRKAVFAAREAETPLPVRITLWRNGERMTIDVLSLPPPPDLTRDGKKDKTPAWNLGPTGAKGWIFARGLNDSDARQILVEQVDEGSPGHGVLAPGDVILGVNGRPFAGNARTEFGRAITEAEKSENGGALKLLVWRPSGASEGDTDEGAGERLEAAVRLPVMGSYGDRAPFQCPKSKLIVEQGCRAIVERGIGSGIVGAINALALLAGGSPEHLDAVREFAHRQGPKDLRLEIKEGMFAWEWGYANLFLTEYYLSTGDEYVLPAIREYSRTMAMGQGVVGTWGHGMRVEGNNGTLGGYGAVNQAGLICWLSLALARKCGIDDPVVSEAVAHSQTFFGFFAGKGCVPYGDHPAGGAIHDNNGTSGSAALAFDLIGDREGARFFSRMAAAAFDEKELGHTGNFFGYLWGALGANRAGPDAVVAYLKELQGYYDMARRWDGRFATNNKNNYGWDMTGLFVLHYSLPARRLYITGRGTRYGNRLTGRALRETIESGRDFSFGAVDGVFLSMSDERLLERLGNWSPSVRHRSAAALVRKESDVVPQLIDMLKSRSLDRRYGACLALQYMGGRAAAAVDGLIGLLAEKKDPWLRIRAAFALAEIGPEARKAVPDLLKMAAEVDPSDPRGTLCRYLSFVLFKSDYVDNLPRRNGLLADSLDGVDRDLLYPAVKRMLTLDDGLARFATRSVLRNMNGEDLRVLCPDLVAVTRDTAPSGEMFAQHIRVDAARLLAANGIPEGMHACIEYARTQNGWGSRTIEILQILQTYGAAGRVVLPELKELQAKWKGLDAGRPEPTRSSAAEAAIHAIEASR